MEDSNMQTGPQFAVGDIRRTKDCQDEIQKLISNAVDIMVTQGWDTTEVLEAAEAALKEQWKSIEADPDPQDAPTETAEKPYPAALRAG
jgi:hypothetical protein